MIPADGHEPAADPFRELISGIEVKPDTSYEAQKQLLEEIRRRHDAARQEAGITAVAVDRLPVEGIGPDTSITLRRVKPDEMSDEMFLRIHYSVKREPTARPVAHNIFLTAGQRVGDTIVPSEDFTPDQAKLVFIQADELVALKNEGYLPSLQADLADIFNNATALRAAPREDAKEQ